MYIIFYFFDEIFTFLHEPDFINRKLLYGSKGGRLEQNKDIGFISITPASKRSHSVLFVTKIASTRLFSMFVLIMGHGAGGDVSKNKRMCPFFIGIVPFLIME